MVLSVLMPTFAHAEAIDIVRAQLESTDVGYKLSTRFSFELNHNLEDAINRGLPLFFTTEVELTRPRWYWLDEKDVATSKTISISYNVLTRRYQVSTGSSLQQNFTTLDEALWAVKTPVRWLVADKNELKPGATYKVAVRMRLDVTQLSKPLQINAFNNSDWRMSSDWKRFNFRVEDK